MDVLSPNSDLDNVDKKWSSSPFQQNQLKTYLASFTLENSLQKSVKTRTKLKKRNEKDKKRESLCYLKVLGKPSSRNRFGELSGIFSKTARD